MRKMKSPFPLSGLWQNEYGSSMAILVHEDQIAGIYESTTGSTGAFVVTGYQQSTSPKASGGRALAIVISWTPLQSASPGPSAHWCSGLSGQVFIKEGRELMIMSHALVAPNTVAGRCEAGIYLDKLIYTRVEGVTGLDRRIAELAQTLAPGSQAPLGGSSGALGGAWIDADGVQLDLEVALDNAGELGRISGSMVSAAGEAVPITGVTDIRARSSNLSFQSAAIAARLAPAGQLIALAGTLDLGLETLSLLELSSGSTVPSATYLQTRARARVFKPMISRPTSLGLAS